MLSKKRIAYLFLIGFCLITSTLAYGQSAYELYKEGKEFRSNGKNKKAIKSFEEALDQAESNHNRSLQMSCHIELAELKDNVINYKEALSHYKAFTELYKKKLNEEKEELVESVDELETTVEQTLEEIEEKDSEIEKKDQDISSKEKEISNLTKEQLQDELEISGLKLEQEEKANQRNILIGVIAIVVVILIFFWLGYIRKRKTNKTLRNKNYQIFKEKEKSDELLHNILPHAVAEELKEFGRTTPSSFDSAAIMFTDFKGFTKFAENISPEELVQTVDSYFAAFDEIIQSHGIEKIKTIGDAYMCVSGVPEPIEEHVHKMIAAAKDIKDYVGKRMEEFKKNNAPFLEIRIGIHAGPLVAGVVGSRKFAYDVWGDAVNIAARMEQSGEPGKINVSENVYELTQDQYKFEYRGEVEAKNKGKMKMYFLLED